MAQRTCRDFDSWDTNVSGMASEATTVQAEPIQPGIRKETALSQNRIQTCTGMALTEDKAVPINPIRLSRINAQGLFVQHCQNVYRRKDRPRM